MHDTTRKADQLASNGELTFVTKLEVYTPDQAVYLEWLARLMMAGVESAGALSAEIFPPFFFGSTAWILVQRFSSVKQMQEWLTSDQHRQLLNERTQDVEAKKIAISEAIDSSFAMGGSISVAVVTHVKEGHEAAYFAHESKYQAAQATAAGFHGAYVQPPTQNTPGTWITILRFSSLAARDQWFTSKQRKQLVEESTPVVRSTDFHNVTTSFPGWFPSQEVGGKGPPNWKTAMLILLGLYPSVMLVIKYFLPLMQGYPLAVNNFIGNILTVAFTTWITMPLFIKIYKSWLFPDHTTPRWVAVLSILSILVLYAVEIAFFWRFF